MNRVTITMPDGQAVELAGVEFQTPFGHNPDYHVGVGTLMGRPVVAVSAADGWEITSFKSLGEAIERASELGWDPVTAGMPTAEPE